MTKNNDDLQFAKEKSMSAKPRDGIKKKENCYYRCWCCALQLSDLDVGFRRKLTVLSVLAKNFMTLPPCTSSQPFDGGGGGDDFHHKKTMVLFKKKLCCAP